MATKAERSAKNKQTQAMLHEAREAEKAQRAADKARKAAEAEAVRGHARARAQAAMSVLVDDIPKTQGEVRAIAKALTPRMLELLVEIAEDPTQQASGRVAAINALIDRAHGKPVQPTVELPGAVLGDMDDEQLDVFIVREAKHFIDGKVNLDVQQHAGTTPAQLDAQAALIDARPADGNGSAAGSGSKGKTRRPRAPKGGA